MASRNPFALLSDEPDASDNEQQTLPKVTKPTAVDAAPKNNKPARTNPIPGATTRRSVPGQTTVRPQKEATELPASDAPAGDKAQFEGERGRDTRGTGFGRGRGGARGARGGADRPPRGDRTEGGRGGRPPRAARPDRHSQTGKVDSDKAEHQGWGGDDGKRELENENAGVTDAAAEKGTETPVGEAADAAAPAEKAPEVPAEPEDTSKTYEEFLKERKTAGRGVLDGLSTQARKANEGADDSQWKDGVAISKDSEDAGYFADLQKDKAAKARKERKEKTFLEVEFQAPARPGSDRDGARGGRGGRGGRGRGEGAPRGRGSAGRGGRGRGTAAQSNGINLSDNNAFPTLA